MTPTGRNILFLFLFLFVLSTIFLGYMYAFVWNWKPCENAYCVPSPRYFDGTIKTPRNKLYLAYFKHDPFVKNIDRMCRKMWYSYRFVRNTDGGYGVMSPWTEGPIYAGSTNLPCKGTCDKKYVDMGRKSCDANHPIIGTVEDLEYDFPIDDYYPVVYRQLDTLDTSKEGDIVGILLPSASFGLKYMYDEQNNPNEDDKTCKGCPS